MNGVVPLLSLYGFKIRTGGENYTVYLYNNKHVAVRHGPVLTDIFRVNSLRNGTVP